MFRTSRVLLMGLLIGSLPMFGASITADGSYHEFGFNNGGFASGCSDFGGCVPTGNPVAEQLNTAPWTFTGSATLFVLDLFNAGDRFQVFDFGVSLGTTSVVTNTGTISCGTTTLADIGCSAASAAYSKGTFIIAGTGNHSITIQDIVVASGLGSGAAVLSLSNGSVVGVPEPTTIGMLGAGLVGLAFLGRRRKAQKLS